jgi:uncharacterized repeat protein (TIGR01451 family)
MHTLTRVLAAVSVAAVLSQPAWAQTARHLVISMSHSGNFTVGVNGIYTIVVSNTGATASSGLITVIDPLIGSVDLASIWVRDGYWLVLLLPRCHSD